MGEKQDNLRLPPSWACEKVVINTTAKIKMSLEIIILKIIEHLIIMAEQIAGGNLSKQD